MLKTRDKIERLFERSGRALHRNPLKVLFVVFLFAGALIYQSPKISFDCSPEGFFHKNHPDLLRYSFFRDQFGQPDLILIAVRTPQIFNISSLHKLKSLHRDLEREVPYLRKVTSLINARRIHAEGDDLFIEELLGDWPKENFKPAVLRRLVLSNPVYLNHIISEDGLTTAVLLETESCVPELYEEVSLLSDFEQKTFSPDENVADDARYLSGKETKEITKALHRVVNRHRSSDFSVSISGAPYIFEIFDQYQIKDALLCLLLSNIIIIFFLAILFRRISGVLLPLIVVNLACFSTIGLMVLTGVPIKMTTVVMPAFLLAVGVADSVHILAIFYRRLDQGHSKENAIAFTLRHSGLPIVMTSLTTAAGLLSFSFANVTAISEMGVFSAAGVSLALLYSIIMLPSLLAIAAIKPKIKSNNRSLRMDRFLLFFANCSINFSKIIIVVSLVIFLIITNFVFQLDFVHDVSRFFPDNMTVKKDLVFIDRHFKGILTLEVVVDTKQENGIYDPVILNRIEKLSHMIGKIENADIYVGKIFSINDILKEINQALHGNDKRYYAIPQDRKAIAQELLLFESSGVDDLERIVDSKFSKTRITIKTSWVGAIVGDKFREYVQQQFNEAFKNLADTTVTGMLALLARMLTEAIHSTAKSYVIAFLVITVLMILLVGNVKIGLLIMIPNLLPIVFIMGLMGAAGIPLDMCSLMIGTIALGLVVDDTVHFIYNFQRFYRKTGDPKEAVRETLLGTGRAILITSLVLSAGFFVLLCASLKHTTRFGFFSGLVIVIALLADFLLAPALMLLINPPKGRATL